MTHQQLAKVIQRLAEADAPAERDEIADELKAACPQIVPALVEVLEHDSRFVRMTAAAVLGDVQAAEAVPALIERLGDQFVRVRRSAMRALIAIGQPSVAALKQGCAADSPSVQRLSLTALRALEVRDAADQAFAALQSDNIGVRQQAARLLASSDDERAFEAAVDCLGDEDVAINLAQYLVGQVDGGRDALLHAARGQDRIARRAAGLALANDGCAEGLGALIDGYTEDGTPVGWEAPEVVEHAVEVGEEVPFDLLLAQARGDYVDPDERWAYHGQRPAIEALGALGDPRAIPLLTELLDSEHDVLGRLAAQALGQIGAPGCAELLVGALGHHSSAVRGAARPALVRLGEDALGPVLQALSSNDRAQRENAAAVLSDWGAPAAPGLLQAAAGASPTQRWATLLAVHMLAAKHADAATDELRRAVIAALDDEDDRVRRAAAFAESELRDPEAIPALIAHLRDPDRQVRRKCAAALAAIGGPGLRAVVEAMRAGGEHRELYELGRALAAMGEDAVAPASELARDPRAEVRWGAGTALGMCGSERAAPALLGLADDEEHLPVLAAVLYLDRWPSEDTAQALERIAANEKHDADLRREAQGAARGVREKMRLEDEAPDDDDDQ